MAQGGSKPTTSQTSSTTPWSVAAPYLQTAIQEANTWLWDPKSSATYSGTRVIPFSNQSTWGMNNAQSFAQGAGQNMQNQAGGIIGNGGFNSQQQSALGTIGTGASGGMNVDNSQFNSVYGNLSGGPASAQNLSGMASGQMLGNGNPFLRQALGVANENAMTGVGDAMSAAGRYGSGVHQTSLAKTINDSNTNAMFGQYNQDVANMMGANNQIDNARLGYAGQQLNAAQGAAGVASGNSDRMLGAASGLFNAGQAGLGNMTKAYEAGLQPGQTMTGIGAAYEDLAAKYAQEGFDKFNAEKQARIDAIAQANAIFTGAGSLGNNQQQKVYQPTQWGQVGANAAGAALAGK